MFLQIGEIAEQIPEITIHHKCEFVDQIFKRIHSSKASQ